MVDFGQGQHGSSVQLRLRGVAGMAMCPRIYLLLLFMPLALEDGNPHLQARLIVCTPTCGIVGTMGRIPHFSRGLCLLLAFVSVLVAFVSVLVCMCVRVRVRARVCVCVCVGGGV